MHAWRLYDDDLYLPSELDTCSGRKQDHKRQLHLFGYDQMEEQQQRELHRDGKLIRLEG